ncbi:MAG: sulfatase-like hydrolase/transferase [Chitinophagales bacterium]
MKKIYFILILMITGNFSYSQNCFLPKPVPQTDGPTACTIPLYWEQITGAHHYQVKYKVSGSNNWLDTINTGANTTVTLTGLLPKTKYISKVTVYCAGQKAGGTGSITVRTLACSAPVVTELTVQQDSSVYIAWSGCSPTNNSIRYRLPGSNWTKIKTGSNSFATLSGLLYGASYEYEVKSCSMAGKQYWSQLDSFTLIIPLLLHPNILILLVDDGSYNTYLPNGGPDWFTSPSINRIANEGVNFNSFFVTLSVCNPSRATLLTGLMANHHGLIANQDTIISTIPTIGSILKNNGYHTSFIGKYPDIYNSEPRKGWNYWMAFEAGTGLHENADYNINGVSTEIQGYNDYTLTDTAIRIIKTLYHKKPFLIVLAYSGVHEPYLAPPGMEGRYDNENITVPDNFYPYTQNYPSQLYEGSIYPTADSCINDLRNYYEMLNGIDTTVSRLFAVLDSLNATDSTMIIYTSDNGFLRGEHILHSKTKAYEPSMRVPLFIRYPQWFTPGTTITDPITLNIDLAPTVIEAAGISNTYNMDGHSLHDYYKGTLDRDEFYFQSSAGGLIRAVRSKEYKYTWYNCTQQTEEFFNLVSDPKEDTNHINTSSYQSLIAVYREKLDSFQNYWGDTINKIRKSVCYLANPVLDRMSEVVSSTSIGIYPNPASSEVQFFWKGNSKGADHVRVFNESGTIQFEIFVSDEEDQHQLTVPLNHFANGIYNVVIGNSDRFLIKNFEVLK